MVRSSHRLAPEMTATEITNPIKRGRGLPELTKAATDYSTTKHEAESALRWGTVEQQATAAAGRRGGAPDPKTRRAYHQSTNNEGSAWAKGRKENAGQLSGPALRKIGQKGQAGKRGMEPK